MAQAQLPRILFFMRTFVVNTLFLKHLANKARTMQHDSAGFFRQNLQLLHFLKSLALILVAHFLASQFLII